MKFILNKARTALLLSLFALLLAACDAPAADDQPETGSGEAAIESSESSADKSTMPGETPSDLAADEPPTDDSETSSEPEGGAETRRVEPAATEVAMEPEPIETREMAEAATEEGIMTVDDRSDRQREYSAGWNTDFSRHTVPYDELLALLPVRDGIAPIDVPSFETVDEAASWLAPNEPVISLEINGDARAYPLQILTWHEIVNDTVGELPVIVTFCPLCNSALVFDRRLGDEIFTFGTSGWLRHSDLVMWDRNTESLWQQFTGEGIVGQLAGEQLEFIPSSIISFADFIAAYPEGVILSRNTGYGRPYGQNPYPGYDTIGQDPFAFIGVPDRRIAAMERVVTVSLDDVDVAYPLLVLAEMGVINDRHGDQDLAIFHTGGTSSALDSPVIAMGDDVGSTGVFDPYLDGQVLSFVKEGDLILDEQTGSSWNIVGQAVDGPLAGSQLVPIVHGDHFWFSWAAFNPDTVIFGS
jgi:hypothetical protein